MSLTILTLDSLEGAVSGPSSHLLTVLTKVSVGSFVREACEHAFVMYADALLLLFELADREDERFQQAAARWHARFVLEAGLPLREAEGVMTLLCRLRGADRLVVRRRLLATVERAGLTTREIRSGA
jgi:hypothetical protein